MMRFWGDRSEENVGNEEAKQAKSSYHLDRHTACCNLLNAHSGRACGDSLLGILVDCVALSLSESLLFCLLAQSEDGLLGFLELCIKVVGRRGNCVGNTRGCCANGGLLVVCVVGQVSALAKVAVICGV